MKDINDIIWTDEDLDEDEINPTSGGGQMTIACILSFCDSAVGNGCAGSAPFRTSSCLSIE